MRVSEFRKAIKKIGCRLEREGSNHEIWRSPITGEQFRLSRDRNKDLTPKAESELRKLAGLKK